MSFSDRLDALCASMQLAAITSSRTERDALALADAWLSEDAPLRTAPTAEWVARFRSLGGFLANDHVDDAARPVRPMRLLRAAAPAYVRGMSWTPYRAFARSFAIERHRERGARADVWEVTMPPEAMLAAFGDGGREDRYGEIVADPELIPTPRRVATFDEIMADRQGWGLGHRAAERKAVAEAIASQAVR